MLETGSQSWAAALKKIVYDRNNERARVLKTSAFKMFFARENWHNKPPPEDFQPLEWGDDEEFGSGPIQGDNLVASANDTENFSMELAPGPLQV